MKTLLQINSVVNSGSTGRIAEGIGRIAMQNGWQSYIAYARNERHSHSELIKIGTKKDIIIHGLSTRLFDRHGFASKNATKNFIEKVTEIKPDIIHLHNIHGYYINIGILFNFLAKINVPVVWTFHDCWPVTGHCVYFDYIGCDKWKTGCYSCPQKKSYPTSLLFDRSKENYRQKKELFTSVKNMVLVPVSAWLGDILSQSILNKYPIKQIHNGINTTLFKPVVNNTIRKKYHLENKFIILGVANVWEKRKGLDDFIELSNRLNDEYKIILVGLKTSQIKKLPRNILGIQKTESIKELAEFYSAADVFLNPTWEDNFPTTNLEALACGTPVITYKTGGSPEAIDSQTGFVVEKGDISGIIKAIKEVKTKVKSFYSTACRTRAVDYFDENKRFLEYIRLYETLV